MKECLEPYEQRVLKVWNEASILHRSAWSAKINNLQATMSALQNKYKEKITVVENNVCGGELQKSVLKEGILYANIQNMAHSVDNPTTEVKYNAPYRTFEQNGDRSFTNSDAYNLKKTSGVKEQNLKNKMQGCFDLLSCIVKFLESCKKFISKKVTFIYESCCDVKENKDRG